MKRKEKKTEAKKKEAKVKTCTKCGRTLPVDEFWKIRKDKPWRCPRCKDCARAIRRSYYKGLEPGVYMTLGGQLYHCDGMHRRIWFGELEEQRFKRDYPTTRNEELAERYDCSQATIMRKARDYGLKKDRSWMQRQRRENAKNASFYRMVQANKK